MSSTEEKSSNATTDMLSIVKRKEQIINNFQKCCFSAVTWTDWLIDKYCEYCES